MNEFQLTFIILHRTDTNEYLTHFEFWNRNSLQWSAHVNHMAIVFDAGSKTKKGLQ
jgi:hypothetical protein